KYAVMRGFTRGPLDVLMATTVIKVAADAPSASDTVTTAAVRIHAPRLHTLRGLVSRGGLAALCRPVSPNVDVTRTRARLAAVAPTLDGFELSPVDLEQRREGDVLGAAQSGKRSSLKLLQLLRDEDVIAAARDEAATLLADDPDLTSHPALRAEIDRLLEDEKAEYLEKT